MDEWVQTLIAGFVLVIAGLGFVCMSLIGYTVYFSIGIFCIGVGVGGLVCVYSVYKFEKKAVS